MNKYYLLTFFLSCQCVAGTQSGKIDYFDVRSSDGLHYFALEGVNKVGSPACAKNTYWIIRDENSSAGKSQVSMVLAAMMSNKNISVTGSNECSRWGDGEDVNIIRID